MNNPNNSADKKKLEADRTKHYDAVSSKLVTKYNNEKTATATQITQVASSTKTSKGLNIQVGRLLNRIPKEEWKDAKNINALKELYNSFHDSDKELSNVKALKYHIDANS